VPHAIQCIDCGALGPESPCPRCRRRRNKERAATSFYQSPEWRRLSAEARRLNGDACAICGSTQRPTTHHLKNRRTEEGRDEMSNFVILCGAGAIGVSWNSCHSQYEADKRAGKDTELRRRVEFL